jgi:hypothetical protein
MPLPSLALTQDPPTAVSRAMLGFHAGLRSELVAVPSGRTSMVLCEVGTSSPILQKGQPRLHISSKQLKTRVT